MQTPVFTKTINNTSLQLDSLGGGQWWWQVTPFYELNSIGYASPSKVSTFIIEKNDGIAPPILTVPLQNAEIHYKDSLAVNFSWKSDIKASYELLIAKDKDFNDIILKRNTAGQRANVNMSLPEKDGQQYYWKIVRKSSEPEDLTPESDIRSFAVYKYVSVPAKHFELLQVYSHIQKIFLNYSWKEKSTEQVFQICCFLKASGTGVLQPRILPEIWNIPSLIILSFKRILKHQSLLTLQPLQKCLLQKAALPDLTGSL